jgi:hypothetical protein
LPRTYYDVLGVAPSASPQHIKAAYHRLILRHHPDHSADPSSARLTVELNEAYATLRDPAKRTLYDSSLLETVKKERSSKAPSQPIPDIICQKCKVQDATLRQSLMYYVYSFLFLTKRNGKTGIWCSRCRAKESAKWTTFTALFGWWGFPWGIIYSIQALCMNAWGGEQPRESNAAITRVLGYQLYSKGRHAESLRALRVSLNLEANPEAQQLYSHLLSIHPTMPHDRDYMWRFAAAVPSLLSVGAIVFALIVYSEQPSGYESRYSDSAAPKQVSGRTATFFPTTNSSRDRVNAEIDHLAEIVLQRAPVVGTHSEGTTTVTDHVLDRAKFDAAEVSRIADSIQVELDANPDYDGFIASSYFNARVLAISIDTMNNISQGVSVEADVSDLYALGRHEMVQRWLESSRFNANFISLRQRLTRFYSSYIPGESSDELERDINSQKTQISRLREELDQLESSDPPRYNNLVPEFNQKVNLYNSSVHQYRLQNTAGMKLDHAFNQCLDTKILMTKFQNVSLSSHAAEIEAMPDVK